MREKRLSSFSLETIITQEVHLVLRWGRGWWWWGLVGGVLWRGRPSTRGKVEEVCGHIGGLPEVVCLGGSVKEVDAACGDG